MSQIAVLAAAKTPAAETPAAKTPAELLNQTNVTAAELVATLAEYAGTGAAISFRAMEEILKKNPGIDSSVLASGLSSCITGITSQLTRNFPEDAEQWARLALEISFHVRHSDDAKAIAKARSVITRDAVDQVMLKASGASMTIPNRDEKKVSAALETARLLEMLSFNLFATATDNGQFEALKGPKMA